MTEDDDRSQDERVGDTEPAAVVSDDVPSRAVAQQQAIWNSIPLTDESTPLAAELADNARRRAALAGQSFPVPRETRIFTVANQKGGVGKTTTAVNIAAALAKGGARVLVVDNDPQGNASTALGVDHQTGTPSTYDVLINDVPMAEVVQESEDIAGLYCVPATIDLSGAEIELVSLVARENRLRNAVAAYLRQGQANGQQRIDYVFIDCPPSLGLLTVNAFVAAKEVMIPIQAEYYALEGLGQLLNNINLIRGHLNPGLQVSTILLTMFDGRTNLAHQVAEEVREYFPTETLRTAIPRSVRISEAPSYGKTVLSYDPGSSGSLAYREAAREIAHRGVPQAQQAGNPESSSSVPSNPESSSSVPSIPDSNNSQQRSSEQRSTEQHSPEARSSSANTPSSNAVTPAASPPSISQSEGVNP